MKIEGKIKKVIIVDDALAAYNKLNAIVGEEVSRGIAGSVDQTLFNAIKQKIEFLKENPSYGFHIPKDRIPCLYFKVYDVNNLWKINLPAGWRLIYTIRGSEVEILSIVLDIYNHRTYEKVFGYKKS